MQPYPPAYAVVRDPTDVVGRRIAALVIDWAVAFAIFVVLLLSLADREDYATASRAEDRCDRITDEGDQFCIPFDDTAFVYSWGAVATFVLVPLAYHFLTDAVLTGITGFSPGKGLVGLRVIRQSDGRLCGMGRSMLRWILWSADWAPYCIPIVGLITGLTTKGHRRVGDMAAGTLVVDKHDVGVAPVVPGLNTMAPPPWGPTVVGTPPPVWGQPQYPTPPQWGQPQPPAPPQPQWGQPQPPAAPSPQQWGPPATSHAPPSWGPPSASPPPAPAWGAPPPPPPVDAPANPGVDAPLWDDARDTYIQWDPDLAVWVQWDEATREWHPIT